MLRMTEGVWCVAVRVIQSVFRHAEHDLLEAIHSRARRNEKEPMITRRRFLGVSVAAGLGMGFYTWRVEPHWVQILERRLPISNLPPELSGCRMVQLSDLHIGPRVDDSYLR